MGVGIRVLVGWAAAAAGLGVAGVGVAGAQGASAKVPPVHGAVLTGEKVELPEAFRGKVGVLVVGFSQASREEVAAWGRRLAGDYRDSPAVVYFELAELASVPRLLRGWVLKKITESVPDRAKAHFLPVYDHEAEWRSLAGYSQADDAYVLVVDQAGTVRYRVEGRASDEAYAELKRRIEGR